MSGPYMSDEEHDEDQKRREADLTRMKAGLARIEADPNANEQALVLADKLRGLILIGERIKAARAARRT